MSLSTATINTDTPNVADESEKQHASTAPAIVVTEILVPKVDGLKVCRTLKSDAETRQILVLVFSILAAEDRAREAGADGFLRKPLNEALLVDSVRQLIAPTCQGRIHGPH